MVRDSAVPPERLEEILAWLHPDREMAGVIYVELRASLERIFKWKRSADPEGLTDQVFDRVGKKVQEISSNYSGDPRLFFYGVARNVIRESAVKARSFVPLDEIDEPIIESTIEVIPTFIREECFESCLDQLDSGKRKLIVAYYARDRQAKIDFRAETARKIGVSVETLRVRAFRIRSWLEACIERCLKERGPTQ
jgi:DNA-directed RNA polymerase specialized sigma24 family protein